jgi:gas vesicle protein
MKFPSPQKLTRGIIGAGAALLLVSAPLAAQQPMPPQQQQIPDSVQQMMAEFQEIQERMEALQDQAIAANESLQEQQASIQEQIESAIRAIEPDMDELMERMRAMEAEAQAAQEAQDMERLQEIMNEAQMVNGRLEQAQNQAFQQDEIQEAIQGFQEDLMAEMTEIDPEAEQMLERMEDLAQRLNAAMPMG